MQKQWNLIEQISTSPRTLLPLGTLSSSVYSLFNPLLPLLQLNLRDPGKGTATNRHYAKNSNKLLFLFPTLSIFITMWDLSPPEAMCSRPGTTQFCGFTKNCGPPVGMVAMGRLRAWFTSQEAAGERRENRPENAGPTRFSKFTL